MVIPPLSSSFLSTGFINPDTIEGDEEKVMVDIAETFEVWAVIWSKTKKQKT